MNAPALSAPALTLDGVALDRIFPFYIQVDASMRVKAMGPSLRKLLPQLMLGDLLSSHLLASQPSGTETYQRWVAAIGDLIILRSPIYRHVVLRGTVERSHSDHLMFLVTAVAANLEKLQELRLSLRDFSLHDSLAEVLRGNHAPASSLKVLQKKVEQLQSIVEMGTTGVLYANGEGRVLHLNHALCEILGIDDSRQDDLNLEIFSRHLGSLLAPEEADFDPLNSLLERTQHSHDPKGLNSGVTLRLVAPRHATVHMTISLASSHDVVLYFQDITKEAEVDRMKTEFLTTAAHELRTPMVSIFGFTELLLMRRLDEGRQRELLGTIRQQSQLLINLLNELLDLSRIEARQGKDFHRKFCRISTLVELTIRGLLIQDDKRQVRLYLPHGSEAIMVDPEKTMQALLNVLSNAFKYSPSGGDIVLDTVLKEESGSNQIGIRVRDQGIGMSPDQLEHAFERFWRADPSGKIPGTGLGMSLVKEITELQDGHVEIESEMGRGTSVTLWFPLTDDFSLSRPQELDS